MVIRRWGVRLIGPLIAATVVACSGPQELSQSPEISAPPAASLATTPRMAEKSPDAAAALKQANLHPAVLKGHAAGPRLTGLTRSELTSAIGQPLLLRREGASEVWQYRAPDCVLFVFLHDQAGAQPRVDHVEARSRLHLGMVDAGNCLESLAGRHLAATRR